MVSLQGDIGLDIVDLIVDALRTLFRYDGEVVVPRTDDAPPQSFVSKVPRGVQRTTSEEPVGGFSDGTDGLTDQSPILAGIAHGGVAGAPVPPGFSIASLPEEQPADGDQN